MRFVMRLRGDHDGREHAGREKKIIITGITGACPTSPSSVAEGIYVKNVTCSWETHDAGLVACSSILGAAQAHAIRLTPGSARHPGTMSSR